METQVSGITFRVKENPEVGRLVPSGPVLLIQEPSNKYDKNAIKVYWQDYHIGYIPKGDVQEYINSELNAQRIVDATIISYSYYDKEKKFNDDHEGVLQAITLEIDGHAGYQKDGKDYASVSKVLKYLNPSGSFDNLMRWAMEKYASFEEYEAGLAESADNGTVLHEICESSLLGNDMGFPPVDNFIEKFEPHVLKTEHAVFDDATRVAGTLDALVEIGEKKIVIDWKSSKSTQMKHKLQVAFYAACVGADEAWVVTFGGTQKQGYGITKITGDDIRKYYDIVGRMADIYHILNE